MSYTSGTLWYWLLLYLQSAFPYIASKNPKSLITSGIGLGSILVLFFIAWLISGNEVNASYAEFGVDESLSKFIGGMLNLVYFLAGIAVIGIVASEFRKALKNG